MPQFSAQQVKVKFQNDSGAMYSNLQSDVRTKGLFQDEAADAREQA